MDPKYTIPGTVEYNIMAILTAGYVLLWVWFWPVALAVTVAGVCKLYQQWRNSSGVFSNTTK